MVDYLGLANDLKQALATYSESGGKGQTALDKEEAVAVLREKYEVCSALFHGFDWAKWTTGTPQERMGLLPAAQEHILEQEDGKQRCLNSVRELSQAFALAVPHAETMRVRDDVEFFQSVRVRLLKRAESEARPEEELDLAVRQIISRAVASEGVTDIFSAAGLDKPDISVLSDEFLAEVQGMPHRNLAVELLQKLLKGEVSNRRRKNVVQARSFAEMLEQTPAPLSEPVDRGGSGHRGTNRARQGHARGQRARGAFGPIGRRACLLRRSGDQRQRRAGLGRRDAAGHRPRTCQHRTQQRHHRLDAPRKRPRSPSSPRAPYSP